MTKPVIITHQQHHNHKKQQQQLRRWLLFVIVVAAAALTSSVEAFRPTASSAYQTYDPHHGGAATTFASRSRRRPLPPLSCSDTNNRKGRVNGRGRMTRLAAKKKSDPEEIPQIVPAKTNLNPTVMMNRYRAEYKESIEDPDSYWEEQAYEYLDWDKSFDAVRIGSFQTANVAWFVGGKLNVCYNAIDRHIYKDGRGNDIALIWEGDEPNDVVRFTYSELLNRVCQIANALKATGVKSGDVVTIYMGMVPELLMTMLACARIGAVHSVVFAGFSADALAVRIVAAQSKVLITSLTSRRGGRSIHLKQDIVDVARTKENVEDVLETVLVWESSTFKPTTTTEADTQPNFTMLPKDVWMDPLVRRQRPYCPVVSMDAEDPLFILYTSGSTGQPKGVVHTTAGYALYAAFTTRQTFDLDINNPNNDGEIMACVADCGWITGHTYTVYGPLLNGVTTVLFASTPLYPDPGRYWDMIDRHGITMFYTAPTAIRSLMRYGDTFPAQYKLNTLRILGSVGEPINPEAWKWYYNVIGRKNCTIVDTYWQTETGGHMITNLPGITPMIPGSCTLPLYGIRPVVLDSITGQVIEDSPAEGVLAFAQPWPGMARTCLGDHERYETVYFKPYPGYYFTGDACLRDKDGNIFITGRVDDVLNVSGHRIGTAEVESALVAHPAVAQAAVVGRPHDIKGQAIVGFVTLKENVVETTELIQELRQSVRMQIGPFAQPDALWTTPLLPMTRSGKIMRRILRKIVAGETQEGLGDTSTLADPTVVELLMEKVTAAKQQ